MGAERGENKEAKAPGAPTSAPIKATRAALARECAANRAALGETVELLRDLFDRVERLEAKE